MTDFVLSNHQNMIYCSTKAVSNNQKNRPRLFVEKMQWDELDQNQNCALPLEVCVVANKFLNFCWNGKSLIKFEWQNFFFWNVSKVNLPGYFFKISVFLNLCGTCVLTHSKSAREAWLDILKVLIFVNSSGCWNFERSFVCIFAVDSTAELYC